MKPCQRDFLLMITSLLSLSCFILIPTSKAAEGQESKETHVRYGVNILLRNELWSTFQKQGDSTDNTFDFFLIKTRGFVDVFRKGLTLHTLVQGIQGLNFPDNGAFGPGTLYFTASSKDEDPGNVQLVELSLQIKDIPIRGFSLKGGRVGINDGTEVLYGNPKIDWLKKVRLSERLVGTWDWVNVGRRYDGGILDYNQNSFDINLFGGNVLQGGFDFDNGYEALEDVVIAGGTLTLKKDILFSGSELRVFNIYYSDDRAPAKALAGDSLEINTTGASVVGVYDIGPGQMDILLWSAFQGGNFGNLDQQAFGLIGEIGYQLAKVSWKPWFRLGVAYASGDDDPSDSDHGTFFNLVPTNHKWYGYIDAVAFSNLQDYYFQSLFTLHKKVDLTIDGHLFRLASNMEFWIGGSGAFNNDAFGYTFFKPPQGKAIERNLGTELDFTLKLKSFQYTVFDVGYSHFFGSSGVRVVFDKEDQMDWFYFQTVVNF